MKQTKIRFNLDKLEEMKREIGNAYRARVGVLGSHAAREDDAGGGLSNAELGVIHIFGSLSRGIPPRDFLLMPIEVNRRELLAFMRSSVARAAFRRGDYRKLFALLGLKAEEFVQLAFETGGFGQWPPHAPSTVAKYGPHALLILSGQLRRSITSDVVKGGSPGIAHIQVGAA